MHCLQSRLKLPALSAGSKAATDAMKLGVRVGVDVGSVRVGLAISDPEGILATPLRTVERDPEDAKQLGRLAKKGNLPNPPSDPSVLAVADLIAEHEAIHVFVGLPKTLKGSENAAAHAARDFATALSMVVAAPISLVDERFTTVVAHQALHSSGREMKKHREVVDQAAAVEILQQSLNVERHRGKVPGVAVCSQSLIQGANRFDDGCHDGTEATGR